VVGAAFNGGAKTIDFGSCGADSTSGFELLFADLKIRGASAASAC